MLHSARVIAVQPDRHTLLPMPVADQRLPDVNVTLRTQVPVSPVLIAARADDEPQWVHMGSFEGWPLMVRIIWRVLRWH
jgi:hypothetical protein